MSRTAIANIGDWASQINEYNEDIQSVVTNKANFLDATGDDAALKQALEEQIEAALPEIGAKTLGFVTADSAKIMAAFNYVDGSVESFRKFSGGSCSGQDSDPGDGYISCSTNYTTPIPNRPDILVVQCAVNGAGCKPDGQNLEPIPGLINPVKQLTP